jgi:hypothetical protein
LDLWGCVEVGGDGLLHLCIILLVHLHLGRWAGGRERALDEGLPDCDVSLNFVIGFVEDIE